MNLLSLIPIAIIIIWGVVWEERKEKLYVRIEALEKAVEDLKKKVDQA